ncbi:MAG: HEPN domain-containing protein [Pseudomonadota bacterium]
MTPTGKRPPPGSPEDWLAHAESDLNLARLARDRQEILPEQVCFHAQQAAEKGLKAVLLARRVEFPLSHDIEELLEIAEQGGLLVPPDVSRAGSLTPYAVATHYPSHREEIAPADVEEAIRLAERVVAWATAVIASSEAGPNEPKTS